VAAKWSTLTDPLLIVERLLARSIAHFGQSQGSLFTNQRLQELFGYGGTKEPVEQLLNGNQKIHSDLELSTGGTTLLKLLSNQGRLPSISCNISLKTFISAIRKWSERTSTSPSGRHLRHYKCLLANDHHDYPETDPDPGIKIITVYYQIATSTRNWGVSLETWQASITSMTEKFQGAQKSLQSSSENHLGMQTSLKRQ
jgi:hypothetical protein